MTTARAATTGLLALLAVGALASFGNGSVTVGPTTLVSQRASVDTQGPPSW